MIYCKGYVLYIMYERNTIFAAKIWQKVVDLDFEGEKNTN